MYQALYRKYRPQTFDEVVGQQSVVQTLKAQLCSGKLSHAYLFTGSRGTGKTSCAKILAKAVNCLSPVDGNPCNRCEACRRIDSGSCMDVLEIDAASNNGVDNVRDLRDDAVYSPAEVKKRVYIIDEVHMLSISAFNALLKIIEEPPEHLLFILATTELHKVPATILSRCQRFSFRRLLPEDIASRLRYVAYQEGIDLTPEAAALLARLSDGALRDGMSLLDQCAAGGGTLSPDRVYSCLGLAGSRTAAALLGLLADRNTGAALQLLSEQYAAGKDLSAMFDELVLLSRDLLILKTAPKTGRALLSGICTDAELKTLYPRFTGAELIHMTELLQQTAAGFRASANQRVDAELCIFQLSQPALSQDPAALSARLSKLEQTIQSGKLVVTKQETDAEPQTKLPEEAEPVPAEIRENSSEQAPPEPAPQEPNDTLPVGFWAELVASVGPHLQPAAASMFTAKERSVLRPSLQGSVLTLEADSEFSRQMVDTEEVRSAVAAAAEAQLHRPVRVRILTAHVRKAGEERLPQLFSVAREFPGIIEIDGDRP